MKSIRALATFLTAGLLVAAAASAMDALPGAPPVPADNPMTPAKIELGRKLYFDPRISASGTVSCNTCHNVMEAGEDDRATSVGVSGRQGTRSAPTVWNAAYLTVQFWDGRAATLEEQAKGPMVNPVEMGMLDHASVVKRIVAIPGYQEEFQAVFGGSDPVSIDNVARAIATYERTLVTPHSSFDRYKAGDRTAMSAEALRGMKKIESLGCTSCHSGPVFAGPAGPIGEGHFQKFPTVDGTAYEKQYRLGQDTGRMSVTNAESDRNLWRVPQWRNVAITAPYFHNGSVATLDEALKVMAKTQLGIDLAESDVSDMVAFMKSLTGEFPEQPMPRLPSMPMKSALEDES